MRLNKLCYQNEEISSLYLTKFNILRYVQWGFSKADDIL